MNDHPFLVVSIIDGDLGKIYAYDLYKAALARAAKLAVELCNVSFEEATDELEVDLNFCSMDGSTTIYLAQAE